MPPQKLPRFPSRRCAGIIQQIPQNIVPHDTLWAEKNPWNLVAPTKLRPAVVDSTHFPSGLNHASVKAHIDEAISHGANIRYVRIGDKEMLAINMLIGEMLGKALPKRALTSARTLSSTAGKQVFEAFIEESLNNAHASVPMDVWRTSMHYMRKIYVRNLSGLTYANDLFLNESCYEDYPSYRQYHYLRQSFHRYIGALKKVYQSQIIAALDGAKKDGDFVRTPDLMVEVVLLGMAKHFIRDAIYLGIKDGMQHIEEGSPTDLAAQVYCRYFPSILKQEGQGE